MKLRNENQSGFTFVELMVSLLVLGIISAIAVPLIGNTMENSDIADMFNNSKATSGLAKTQADAGSFNTSSGIPNNLEFTVK